MDISHAVELRDSGRTPRTFPSFRGSIREAKVQWVYRKILLNEHHRREDGIDLLCDAGEHGWELVAITPNNIAYLKREVLPRATREEAGRRHGDHTPGVKPGTRQGVTWFGRRRMATWLKRKQDAGEDIEKYRV